MTRSEKQQEILATMKLIEAVYSSLGTGSWLWGGLVPDVYSDHFLREHDDLDYLTWNLHSLRSTLADKFTAQGWQAQTLKNGDLRLKKDGIKAHLGNVKFHSHAKWTHNGEKGYLLFPITWLRMPAIPFYDAQIHVVEPELQYVLKTHPGLLNPAWKPREKDQRDKRVLRELLQHKNTNIKQLSSQIFSF